MPSGRPITPTSAASPPALSSWPSPGLSPGPSPGPPPVRCNRCGSTRSRTTPGPGLRPGGAPTRSTVTPATPAHGPGPSATSSTTTRRCGSPIPGPDGRPVSSATHHLRTSSASAVIIRSGPIASRRRGCAACGSHFTHSHSAASVGGATTASSASAGLCHSAYCATTALASARAGPSPAAGSPGSSQTVELARNERATGRSGTTACPSRNRRSASAVTGSIPSTGPVCGATSRVASRWAPRPTRSCPKSGSAGLRSHSLPAARTAGHAAGCGCTVSSASRCSAATARTRRRSRDR